MTRAGKLALRLSLAAAITMLPCVVWAQQAPDKQQCVDAYTQAQVLKGKEKLVEAKKYLETCSDPTCPQTLRKDCLPWLGEVEQALPSLTLDVVDDKGAALPGANISIDGARVPVGQAVRVDPGAHTVNVDSAGLLSSSQNITLARGERRQAQITLHPQGAVTPPETSHRPLPILPIVLGGVGVVGVGMFITFGVLGNSKKSELDAAKCKPNCSPSDVDTIKTDYVVADISLAVGLTAIVTATVLFFVMPRNAEKTSRLSNVSIAAAPLRDGGVLGLSGQF